MTGYEPLPWQAFHIHSQDAQHRVGAAGRRAGKTKAVVEEVKKALAQPPEIIGGVKHHPLVYMLAPTYETSMRMWEPLERALLDETSALGGLFEPTPFRARGLIDLASGARVQRKTADAPESLQGERVTFLAIDESHDVSDKAFNIVMPSLLDSNGRLLAIGIAKGSNWFRSYYDMGQMDDYPDVYSFSVPSTANPYLSPKVIADFKARYPEIEYRQHVLGEWADADGQVFRNVDKCFTGNFIDAPDPNGYYIMGLDLANLHDYTVAYIADARTQSIVHRFRTSGLDWPIIEEQIAAVYHEFNCRFVHVDATGMGEPIAAHLRQLGCSIIPFVFSKDSKPALITTLAVELERGNITLPAEDEQLRLELKRYEGKLSGGGTSKQQIKYSAPNGFFDDCVIALALVVHKMIRRKPKSSSTQRYLNFNNKSARHLVPPLPAIKL